MTFRSSHLYGSGPEIQGVFGVDALPLTTVAHIISFLDDDVAALARLCRTSRVLWYMTLPHLWKNTTLKSYSAIRYKDDVPEGFGSASPFSMGLNALVTRNVSSLIRNLSLEGEFGAPDQHEYARAGRVSESIMILNIAVRAALDQCTHLEKLRWDLNIRIQPNIYIGLPKLSRLESLWLRFPTTRSPQPSTDIPPLPNLKSLTFTHFDPLCLPDDISTLLLHATNLQHLTMHFSPRMREQGEPSVVLTHFFRKNIAAKRKLHLKSMNMYNLLNSADPSDCLEAVETGGIEHLTAINSMGLDGDAPLVNGFPGGVSKTHFIDQMWTRMVKSKEGVMQPKSMRIDQLHRKHAIGLGGFTRLERLYLVNARYQSKGVNGVTAMNDSPSDSAASASPQVRTPSSSSASISLRDLYLDNICNVCGPTLKHLIFPARWPLSIPNIARLIRSCPNLTQLAVGIECMEYSQAEVLRLLVPFLTDLSAIRLLAPVVQERSSEEAKRSKADFEQFINLADCVHEQKMGMSLARSYSGGTLDAADFPKLRYIGLGWKTWEVGSLVEEVVTRDDGVDGQVREEVVHRRKVRRVEDKDVQHVEIWRMDSLDIV